MSPLFRHKAFQCLIRLLDLAAVGLAFVAALAVSTRAFTWPSLEIVLALRIKIVNIAVFAAYLALCSTILALCGLYVSNRLTRAGREIRHVFSATTLMTGVLVLLPLRMKFATGEFFVLFWLLNGVFLAASRFTGRQLFKHARSRGRNLRNLVVVGEGMEAFALADRIEKEALLGYRVIRIIDTKGIEECQSLPSQTN